MLKKVLFFYLPLILVPFYTLSQSNPDNVLVPAPYDAGFRQYWVSDPSREMKIKGTDIQQERAMLVNIWYPVEPSAAPSPFTRRTYFDFVKEGKYKAISEAYRNYNLEVLESEIFPYFPDSLATPSVKKEYLEAFLDLPLPVRKDALPIQGKFPVVIYHQGAGASFEDNNFLCEYLAGHGYIVIGSSFFSGKGSLGPDGRLTSLEDIGFLLDYLKKYSFADTSKVAVMGHSLGGQGALISFALNSRGINTVISMETTQEYHEIDHPLWKDFTDPVLESDIDSRGGSLLSFASHSSLFALNDLMKKTDRYYVSLPSYFDHNDYLSQASYARTLYLYFLYKKGSEEDEQDIADLKLRQQFIDEKYAEVLSVTLDFLNHKLKGNRAGLIKGLQSSSRENINYNQLIRHEQKPDGPVPTSRELYQMLQSKGVSRVIKTLRRFSEEGTKYRNDLGEEVDKPIFGSTFSYVMVLSLLKKGKIEEARKLSGFYSEIDIHVASRFISLSSFYKLFGKNEISKQNLRYLLLLEPENQEAKELLETLSKKE
ncbi:hypothetical protein GWK08_06185 [Leptobacterium flavescens]|uniref:Alpha/beta hydrolase n=1 Tax=Leptobacterium flavescens TaxID=472055 RepID=A0A6P0UME6_9FLAO|nr:hypothetical protein [Leptobacterium flavescens]NER13019.1 hypothetical protein [Leptobacterium flavescens]